MKRLLILAAAVLLFSTPARAAVIFQDTFDAENGGVGVLNHTGFANWVVSGGSVDLIGNGFFDFYPGNGLYVDMDGSTGNAGIMTGSAIALGAGSYTLSFEAGGSQRGTVDALVAQVVGTSGPLTSLTLAMGSAVPLTAFSLAFTLAAPDSVVPSFEGIGSDNIGLILDDVRLSSVPEPATMLLLATGMVATWRRRRA